MPRTARMYSRISASFAGLNPKFNTALSPVAIPQKARPPDSSLIVPMALAATAGWRVRGFVTHGPKMTSLVSIAHIALET